MSEELATHINAIVKAVYETSKAIWCGMVAYLIIAVPSYYFFHFPARASHELGGVVACFVFLFAFFHIAAKNKWIDKSGKDSQQKSMQT